MALEVEWMMDEPSGLFLDSSGNGRHATAVTPGWARQTGATAYTGQSARSGRGDDPTVDSADGDDALLWVVGTMWGTYAPQWGGGS